MLGRVTSHTFLNNNYYNAHILSPPPPLSPQHAVFFVLRAIDWMVPDVPESLEVKIKRERYLAKQALADNQEALLVSRLLASSPGQWTR